jgi:hypothetical protein
MPREPLSPMWRPASLHSLTSVYTLRPPICKHTLRLSSPLPENVLKCTLYGEVAGHVWYGFRL